MGQGSTSYLSVVKDDIRGAMNPLARSGCQQAVRPSGTAKRKDKIKQLNSNIFDNRSTQQTACCSSQQVNCTYEFQTLGQNGGNMQLLQVDLLLDD